VIVVGSSIVGALYASATAAAGTFAELVCAAFDLFRRDLLVAMGIKPPESLREERQLWLKLSQLILYGQVPDDLALMPARPQLLSLGGDSGSPPLVVPATGGGTGIVVPKAMPS
jgi:hypothetical protein